MKPTGAGWRGMLERAKSKMLFIFGVEKKG
jgi:hypothetical protein